MSAQRATMWGHKEPDTVEPTERTELKLFEEPEEDEPMRSIITLLGI